MIIACSLASQTMKTYMATCLIQVIAETFQRWVRGNAVIEYILKFLTKPDRIELEYSNSSNSFDTYFRVLEDTHPYKSYPSK